MYLSGKQPSDPGVRPEVAETLRGALKEFEHFPINGILFKDISPMLASRGALTETVSAMMPAISAWDVEAVLAIDARDSFSVQRSRIVCAPVSSWSANRENCLEKCSLSTTHVSIAPVNFRSPRV